jgi:serine/threonine protein kinase
MKTNCSSAFTCSGLQASQRRQWVTTRLQAIIDAKYIVRIQVVDLITTPLLFCFVVLKRIVESNKSYMYNMLFIFLLFSHVHSESTEVVMKERREMSLTVFKRHEQGDIIGDFKLLHHIDYLGLTIYHDNDVYNEPLSSSSSSLLPTIQRNNDADDDIDNDDDNDMPNGLLTIIKETNIRNNQFCRRGDFCLNKNIFLGGHGEIWRANRVDSSEYLDLNTSYILKRMHIRNRHDIKKCAEREIYFGSILKGDVLFSRFETFFFDEDDYWLVFRDEGISLNNLLYAITNRDINPVLQPSVYWKKMRTTQSGKDTLKGIMHQLIKGVSALHSRTILHRDLKPSNILINTENEPRLVIADFSSAVCNQSMTRHLYEPNGPSQLEETDKYSPPEVLRSGDDLVPLAFDIEHPYSYDIWSIGVIFLELILGTEEVFSVDQRTAAMIQHRMRGASDFKIKLGIHDYFLPFIHFLFGNHHYIAMLHASWAEYCIYVNDSSDGSPTTALKGVVHNKHAVEQYSEFESLHPLSSSHEGPGSTLEAMSRAILRRDPLGVGYLDYWGLDLLVRLLRWQPGDRLSLKRAVHHAFFMGPYTSDVDGSEHGTSEDLAQHNFELMRARGGIGEEVFNLDENDTEGSDTVLGLHEGFLACALSTVDGGTSNCSEFGIMMAEVTSPIGLNLVFDAEDPMMSFSCPHCDRSFSDWASCHAHLVARKHGIRCVYDASRYTY